MAQDNLSNKEKYITSVLHARRLYDLNIITLDDLKDFDKKLQKKYCIKTNSLYLSIDWIYTLFRGNM